MTSGGEDVNDFPGYQLTKFCAFIGWSRLFIPPPLNFYEASRFVPPIGWTPLTDTTDKRTCLCPFVCLSACLLDGVWH